MSLEDAVNQMELVGHDFFLFHDSDTDRPSVVYRGRGWSYGVLHLETDTARRRHGLTAVGPVGEVRALRSAGAPRRTSGGRPRRLFAKMGR